MNKNYAKAFLGSFLMVCIIGLNACSNDSSSDYISRGLEVPKQVGDTLYLSSGVKYVYMNQGEGPHIDPLCDVQTHINLIIGTDTVWSTYAEDQDILEFTAKKTSLIDGFDEVVMYLKEGDRILAVIPSELGYKEEGRPPLIPGNSTLFFDLDILEVQPADTVNVKKP